MSEPQDHSFEFDCCECGRHIINIAGERPDPRLCGICITVPGWMDVRELREILDSSWSEEDRP